MKVVDRLAVALMVSAMTAWAQAPKFEVATVRPAAPLDMAKMAADIQAGQMPKVGVHVEAGRAEYTYVALRDLIALAWGVKPYQITGPDWMANTRFDIIGKMPEGAAKEDVPKMLQSLLEERFGLAVHKTSAEHPVLALVAAKGGSKLKESAETPAPIDENAPLKPGETKMEGPDGTVRMTLSKDGHASMDMGVKGKMSYAVDPATQSMHLEGSMITMPGFADMLTQLSQLAGSGGRQIVDMTGLKGYYQIAIDFGLADLLNMARAAGLDIAAAGGGQAAGGGGPGAAAADPGGSSSITEAVEALGLKLESRKAMVEQLIVDHANKTPTEN